jgi:membrane fusion protein, multidrug efflux system
MRDARSALGRFIAFAVIAGAVVLGVVVVRRVVKYPKTDDAIVMADIIGVVPQVSGTITELHVVDNQAVKQGDLLFVIDPRPYELAVKRARAELAALEGEIDVTRRHIDGQRFGGGESGGAANGGAGEERHRQPQPPQATSAAGVRDA